MKPLVGDRWPRGTDPRAKPQPEAPKHRAKKDTKRWCLGRVGRRHRCAWETEFNSLRWSPFAGYPDRLILKCQNKGCNKAVLDSYRLARAWPTQWGSRHDPASVPAFYGPGLPGDFGWGGGLKVPEYVDVIGEPVSP